MEQRNLHYAHWGKEALFSTGRTTALAAGEALGEGSNQRFQRVGSQTMRGRPTGFFLIAVSQTLNLQVRG